MAVSRYLVNVFVRHQVYLERLKAGLVGSFDPTMRAIDSAITAALVAARVTSVNELTNRQVTKLIEGLTSAEEDLLSDYARKLSKELEGVAEYESQFADKALANAIISNVTINSPKAGLAWGAAQTQPIQATGQLLQPFINTWTGKTLIRTEAVIRNAHAQGWTISQTTSAIRGTRKNNFADGILQGTRTDIDAMVRTAVQHVSNAARNASWEANADIVIGARWISTLDSNTTQQCRSLDQRVFPIDSGPRPPIHIKCRSTTVPELAETLKLLTSTTRASKGADGGEPVPANQKYYDWLLQQPASFQDTAIGPVRGKLLREGGLSADEFSRLNLGRVFEPLTLKEMKQLAPEAFSRAGL